MSEYTELDLLIDFKTKEARFLKAKEGRDEDPEEWAAAKADFSAFRKEWRKVRSAMWTAQAGHVALEPISTTAETYGD